MRSASRPLALLRSLMRPILGPLVLAGLVFACAPRPSSDHASHERSLALRDDFHAVLARRTPELMAIEGVSGTGEGMDGQDTVLVVFVTRRTSELERQVPREVDGWRIVIREVGEVTAPPK